MLPKVGLVGTPEQVALLVSALRSQGFQVQAIWCKYHDVASQLAEQLSIPHCPQNFQDLLFLHDVDLVYVATEPGLQAEVAVKALTSGKHCVCQKPPSISRDKAEKMFLLSQYYSQLRSVLECHVRYLPAFVKMKHLLDNGYIGGIQAIDVRVLMGSLLRDEGYSWKCDPSVGGGVLNQMGAHVLDAISYLNDNSTVKTVHCWRKIFRPTTRLIHGYRVIDSDDYCSMQLEYSNRVCATVLINSHCEGKYDFECLVTGSKGQLSVKGLDLYSHRGGSLQGKIILKQDTSDIEEPCGPSAKLPLALYQSLVLGYRGMLAALRDMFLKNQSVKESRLMTFNDALHLRQVLDCAFESSRARKWVDIPGAVSNTLERVNPFWTSSTLQKDAEKHSPKPSHPVSHV